MFALFGFGGQTIYNILDTQHTSSLAPDAPRKPNFAQRFAAMRWSPVSLLSDADYENMLREKALKFDVEIALLDDRIADLKVKAARMELDAKAAAVDEGGLSPGVRGGEK